MSIVLLDRPTDLETAMSTIESLVDHSEPEFAKGLLCSLTILSRERDGLPPLGDYSTLDYAMIRLNGFAPE